VINTELQAITVGRSSRGQPVDLDLTPDMQVSHLHARIVWEDERYWIEDLGSRNGTWVNGAQVRGRTPLISSDRIQVGQTRIRLEPDPSLVPAVTAVTPPPALTPAPARSTPVSESTPDAMTPSQDRAVTPVQADGLTPAESGSLSVAGADHRSQADVTPDSEPEGIVASRIISGEHPSVLILPTSAEVHVEALEATRRRLVAFYNLGAALGIASNLEAMVTTIVRHLVEAISGAHRGALLLSDGRKLLLKAHVPGGGDPGTSQSLAVRAMENHEGFIWQDGLPQAPEPSESIIMSGTRSAMYAPMIWGGEALGVVCVDNISSPDAFDEDDLRLLMAMANHAAMFVKNQSLQQELRREAAMRSTLLRQFSPRIAERLLQERGRLRLGGERANPVTILVSDVRGFTAISAAMDPDDVVQLLNAMYALFTPIIFKYEGTVDKFVGDSLLAVFGSPEPDERQCEHAVRAAIDMQQAMGKLADVWRIRGMPVWETGIGIHTGEVVHGFIGSPERMEYTVIGDTVNRAARFCDGAAPGEILISRTVYEHVYRLVQVSAKTVETKHPEVEPVLEAFVVNGVRESQSNISNSQQPAPT
jgi:adenylate cyclase